jgi:hypothetical protein
VEVTRENVVDALRRAGLWDEAEQIESSLPDSIDIDDLADLCAARGITRDTSTSLLGGSP